MASWSDVAAKALDFLQKPNAMGFGILLSIMLFLGYTIPLGVITWTSYQNTNRLERAITALGNNCKHDMAISYGKSAITK